MEEPNLETLIRIFTIRPSNLSEDLVNAPQTAKKLPSNERLLAVRLSGLVTLELLKILPSSARVIIWPALSKRKKRDITGVHLPL